MLVLSDVAAEQLVRIRNDRGYTREQLAKRCAELGWPALTYGVITTIEQGRRDKATGRRRREISLDEWVVFARALDVTPVLFLAPLGQKDQVEILPGIEVSTFRAFRWLTGATKWIDIHANRLFSVTGKDFLIMVYDEHQAAWDRYVEAQLDGRKDDERAALRDIQMWQKTMSENGWRIPPMPGDDDEETEA